MDAAHQVVAQTFRQEADRILASLIGSVRDFELAQDAFQDALLVALERWPIEQHGVKRLTACAASVHWHINRQFFRSYWSRKVRENQSRWIPIYFLMSD